VRSIIGKEKQQDPQYSKYLWKADGEAADEILTNNEILDHIEREKGDLENDIKQVYKARRVCSHQGTL
jgi:hypothetical protein